MKTITLILLSICLSFKAQNKDRWEPEKVLQTVYDSATIKCPGDTLIIRFDNYAYTYAYKGTPVDMQWNLVQKHKLYIDYYKAAGIAYFCINMSAMIVLPQTGLHADKYLHFGAGYIAGLTFNLLIYKWTHSKIVGLIGGIAAGIGLGLGKEYIYDRNFGGVVSWKDAAWTGIGGIDGSSGVTIVIGHKQKAKEFIQL